MKRLAISVVSALMLAVVPIASASALTDVAGHVSKGSKDVSGASVSASCTANNQTATGTSSTGTNGDYNVVLTPDGVCGQGDTVVVTASKNGASGQNSGPLSNYGADVNIALVNVSLPELGAMTAIGAAILGGGAFFVIRRRKLSENA